MKKIGVIGAGTMGHGIAQVSAMAGYEVWLSDRDQAFVDRGIHHIQSNLDKGVARGKVTEEVRQQTLSHLHGTTDLSSLAADADLIIEVGGLIAPFDAYSVKEAGENICLCSGFSSEARHLNFGRIPWGGAPPWMD